MTPRLISQTPANKLLGEKNHCAHLTPLFTSAYILICLQRWKRLALFQSKSHDQTPWSAKPGANMPRYTGINWLIISAIYLYWLKAQSSGSAAGCFRLIVDWGLARDPGFPPARGFRIDFKFWFWVSNIWNRSLFSNTQNRYMPPSYTISWPLRWYLVE